MESVLSLSQSLHFSIPMTCSSPLECQAKLTGVDTKNLCLEKWGRTVDLYNYSEPIDVAKLDFENVLRLPCVLIIITYATEQKSVRKPTIFD